MTEGWWRFADTARRQHYPLMPRAAWLSLLHDAGFRCAALAEDGPAPTLTRQQTILVAQMKGAPQSTGRSRVLFLRSKGESDLLPSTMVAGRITLPDFVGPIPQPMTSSQLEILRAELYRRLQAADRPSSIVLELRQASGELTVPDATLDNAAILLAVLQVAAAEQHPVPVFVLTRCAAAVEAAEEIDLTGSFVAGMAKTARLEHPELSIRSVDLPMQPSETDRMLLARLINNPGREHALALRGGKLFAPRLLPLGGQHSPQEQPVQLIAGATYLVTGAYGGLGFRTVQWMVEHGADSIVMVGRTRPSPQIGEAIASLRMQGVKILDLVADISDRLQVESVFRNLSESGARLHGIVHTAGTLDDATLLQQTPERLAKVFAAKVQGSWHLHEFSRRLPLDFFVLFGSAASVLGSPGQSNHSAVNSFLDALSHFRQREGLPSITVAWGAWSSIGAATRMKNVGRAARPGLGAFSPEKGIELLEQAISSGKPEVAALSIDWSAFLGPGQAQRDWSFFERLSVVPPGENHPVTEPVEMLISRLESSPAENRLHVIKQHLQARIQAVLQTEAGVVLHEEQPLAELGLDSLMSLELKNGLQKELGFTLPANFFFEYPTLGMAATFLSARLVIGGSGFNPATDSSQFEELAL
jgi:NAD(P)-dependent dehydrogenase (short-subunit alcohol dehydrogenase family)/acyl carrier protein